MRPISAVARMSAPKPSISRISGIFSSCATLSMCADLLPPLWICDAPPSACDPLLGRAVKSDPTSATGRPSIRAMPITVADGWKSVSSPSR